MSTTESDARSDWLASRAVASIALILQQSEQNHTVEGGQTNPALLPRRQNLSGFSRPSAPPTESDRPDQRNYRFSLMWPHLRMSAQISANLLSVGPGGFFIARLSIRISIRLRQRLAIQFPGRGFRQCTHRRTPQATYSREGVLSGTLSTPARRQPVRRAP